MGEDKIDAAHKFLERMKKNPSVWMEGFETEKYQVLRSLIEAREEIATLVNKPGVQKHEVIGFLMEQCAANSMRQDKLKNAESAEPLSWAIISYLQRRKKCVPDRILLQCIDGGEVIVQGICEVKTQPGILKRYPMQLKCQEHNITAFAVSSKLAESVFSKGVTVSLSPDFKKYLIVARNREAFPYDIPIRLRGWEMREIEFTLSEVLYIQEHFAELIEMHEQNASYSSSFLKRFRSTLEPGLWLNDNFLISRDRRGRICLLFRVMHSA